MCVHGASASAIYSEGLWLYSELQLFKVKYPLLGLSSWWLQQWDTEGERPRRVYERRSGTGRSNDIKCQGSGRGNWATATDEVPLESEEPVVDAEKNVESEKPVAQEGVVDLADSDLDIGQNLYTTIQL
ncbi:RGG repeats nuclear RNA binding protein A-like protein [Tanacetum coccineum]